MERQPALSLREANASRSAPARSRFAAQPIRGLILGKRDAELLADLYLHRAMTRGQIQALYFGSVARCNLRLRQLFDHGLVRRHYSPTAPFGAQAVYSAGKASAPIVTAVLSERGVQAEESNIRRDCRFQTSPAFLEHTLAIVDFWIALRNALNMSVQAELEQWLPELLCRHEYDIRPTGTGPWRHDVFKPDGFLRLRFGQGEYHSFFVEIDLGHTNTRQFAAKLTSHQRYLDSGLFAEVFGQDRFTTLIVTPSQTRARNLCILAEEKSSRLFWFATSEDIQTLGALSNIWRRPFEGELMSILASHRTTI